jgi:hypothetical protein
MRFKMTSLEEMLMPTRFIQASGMLAVLLAAVVWSDVGAQQSACSLLTSTDIEVATGAKPGVSHPSDYSVPAGSGKSETVHICMWAVAPHKGQVSLSLGRLPAGGMSAETATKQNPGMDALRAAHWTEEAKSFGKAWCSVMTPPASQKNGLIMSTCSAEVKGMILSVTFTSPTKKLTIDQTKALLDKATGRVR